MSSEEPKQRTKKACIWCKRRKVKCDGKTPCYNCKAHLRLCEYTYVSAESLASLNNESHPKKPKPEEYIKFLENRLFELKKRSECSEKSEFSYESSKSLANFDVMSRYPCIFPRELSKSLIKGIKPENRKEVAIPRSQFYGWNMSGEHYLKLRVLPPFRILIDLVSEYDFAQWLLQFYFYSINPLFSIIHEPMFREQYNKYVLGLLDAGSADETRLFSAVLHLIFAISMRFARSHPNTPDSVRAKLTGELETELFESGYEVVLKLTFEWYSLELIQSWILITFYFRATHRQNSSYTSLGTAIRMSKGMSLNLNVENEYIRPSKNSTVMKSRVFWLVYTWDKLYAFQCGKQFDIRDDTIGHLFPLKNALTDESSLSRPALAMTHLARIAGLILLHNMKSGDLKESFLGDVKEQLQDWKIWWDRESRDYDPLVIRQVYLTYHDINLSMYNKTLFKFLDHGGLDDGTTSHFEELFKHSNAVLAIFQDIRKEGLFFVQWWLNLSMLFNIAVISITLMNTGIHPDQCTRNLSESLDHLVFLKPKAAMAMECIWAIKMLNHISVLRLKQAMETLESVGIDHGPSHVNRVNFYYFGKAKDYDKEETSISEISMDRSQIEDPQFYMPNDLGANLKWFDQWILDIQ